MSVPVPPRAAAVAGAIFTTAFIVLSAVVGGTDVQRTRSAPTYKVQVEQARSDKAVVDQRIAKAKTALDAVTVRKNVESWCDSITCESAASI